MTLVPILAYIASRCAVPGLRMLIWALMAFIIFASIACPMLIIAATRGQVVAEKH